ncbi:Thioredoxin family protein [Candida albicans]|uniref:Thioredoxin family protein n=1 Tax=Candida albicans TaxID=5476 RepID=A0A8H6F5H3_CANAX|nr:Thioredoxin family protein [Candida albicans]
MISPKYSATHYYLSAKALSGAKTAPHIINLYLDYNCPFSAKLFLKLYNTVIPNLEKTHPGRFQFVFVNVIQPWHTNSNLLTEFALAYAKLLPFWDFSEKLFENKEKFYDTANIELTRNQIYEQIYNVVTSGLELKVSKEKILTELIIKPSEVPSNAGNGATADVKYFTKYLRGVGVHVTPTVSIDGIVDDSVSSGSSEDDLVKLFESKL